MLVRALKVEVCGQSKPFSTQHSCPAAARIKPACQPGKHDHYQASKQACKQASKQARKKELTFPFEGFMLCKFYGLTCRRSFSENAF